MRLPKPRWGTVVIVLTAAVAVALGSAPASAAIIATTGSAKVKTAPESVKKNKWESNGKTRIFQEQDGFILPTELIVKINDTAEMVGVKKLVDGTIAEGTMVDSYLLHQDPKGSGKKIRLKGTITFDADIIGVVFKNKALRSSDDIVGVMGTLYPSLKQSIRKLELGNNDNKDKFWISADHRTIKYDLRTSAGMDQIRIFTESATIPAPGSMALLGMAGVAAIRKRRNRAS